MGTAPPFPLPLRNALAELAIAALDDAEAAAALAWLAGDDAPAPAELRARLAAVHLVEADGTLLAIHRAHAERARAHAARAARAAAVFDAMRAPVEPVARAVAAAAALWGERLFFEVHEVLEAVWKTAAGATRQALQGVIQIAVALHHHAHGNARGARTLMREGRERLAAARDALPALDAGRLLADTAPWEHGLAAGTIDREATPPTLALAERTRSTPAPDV